LKRMIGEEMRMGVRNTRTVLMLVGVLALVAAACGNDSGTATAITVTVNGDSISVPSEIDAGVVEVTITGEIDPESEVDFTKVTAGTTGEKFTEGMLGVLAGGPFPDFFEGNAGVFAGAVPMSVTLEPGAYFVWSETGVEGEEPALLISEATVTGVADGELPDTDGTITVQDYSFDVDVSAGDTYTFKNEAANQSHHAVLVNFGDLDPALVEENLPAFIQADESTPPPEAFADVDFDNAFIPGSGVFSPGFSGTFSTTLESGNTYAVLCFIQDRAGSAPHAIAYDMFEVFQVP
jgi:hypothetical protein